MPATQHDLLVKLKAIFDTIDDYSVDFPKSDDEKAAKNGAAAAAGAGAMAANQPRNVGYRSLKNIGVWLFLYALTEDAQKDEVLQRLCLLSKTSMPLKELRSIVDELSEPASVKQIIKDYEAAGGTFELTVLKQYLDVFNKQLLAKGFGDLQAYVKPGDKADALLTLKMENTIKFKWISERKGTPVRLEDEIIDALATGPKPKLSQNFHFDKLRTQRIPFMRVERPRGADFDTRKEIPGLRYAPTKYNERNFHVIELKTGVMKDNKLTTAMGKFYIIEPDIDAADNQNFVQQHYLAILDQARQQFYKDDILKIQFPKLQGEIVTTENRLGIYQVFKGLTVAGIDADLKYLGVRKLKYDNDGGEVYNKEEVRLKSGGGRVPQYYNHIVCRPFLVVYSAGPEKDFYPYFIADPTKDFQLTFNESANAIDQKLFALAKAQSASEAVKPPLLDGAAGAQASAHVPVAPAAARNPMDQQSYAAAKEVAFFSTLSSPNPKVVESAPAKGPSPTN